MKNVFSALLYKTFKSHKKFIFGTFLLFAFNINFILFYVGSSVGDSGLLQLKSYLYSIYHFSFMMILYNIFANQVIRKEVNEKTLCSFLMCPVNIRDIWLSYGIITYIISLAQYISALLISVIIFKVRYGVLLLPAADNFNFSFIMMLLTFLLSFAFVYASLLRGNAFVINIVPILAFLIMFNSTKINFINPVIMISIVVICIGIIFFIYNGMKKINNEKFYLNIIGN